MNLEHNPRKRTLKSKAKSEEQKVAFRARKKANQQFYRDLKKVEVIELKAKIVELEEENESLKIKLEKYAEAGTQLTNLSRHITEEIMGDLKDSKVPSNLYDNCKFTYVTKLYGPGGCERLKVQKKHF